MTCRKCNTEPVLRKVPFGKAGWVEMEMCECEAMRLVQKYENTTLEQQERTGGATMQRRNTGRKAMPKPGKARNGSMPQTSEYGDE